MIYETNFPDLLIKNIEENPELSSRNSDFSISFAMTKEDSYDLEEYSLFLESAIRGFRHSVSYTHYKAYIMGLGIDCCQFHPYINSDMASLEIHHCMMTIYDIAMLISEHVLNTRGMITEFDLSEILRYEHFHNNIPIVMLCKNCHDKYHNQYLYVHPNMIFGKWWTLLERYNKGIDPFTSSMIHKVITYLDQASEDKFKIKENRAKKLLELRDNIKSWKI